MNWIQSKLDELKAQHLLRHVRTQAGVGGILETSEGRVLNFSSNDYLHLAGHPHVKKRAIEAVRQYGTGAGSSRLVTGSLPIHEELESRLAAFKGTESALLYGSGYMANAGVIPSLAGPDDIIFTDKLVHASILDAVKLSGAKHKRFLHNDVDSLHQRLKKDAHRGAKRLIITESVFSMDGDLAPLRELTDLAEAFDCRLMVDEAHATGLFGPAGAGLAAADGLTNRVDIEMGTLSKALGSYGGFIAASSHMRAWFINTSRALIYTTAPPPGSVGAALGSLDVLEQHPHLGRELLARASRLRSLLNAYGLDTMNSQSQIVPVLIGSNERAIHVSASLRKEGLLATAIRPPTVPPHTARLRLSVTLAHEPQDLEWAAQTIREVINRS